MTQHKAEEEMHLSHGVLQKYFYDIARVGPFQQRKDRARTLDKAGVFRQILYRRKNTNIPCIVFAGPGRRPPKWDPAALLRKVEGAQAETCATGRCGLGGRRGNIVLQQRHNGTNAYENNDQAPKRNPGSHSPRVRDEVCNSTLMPSASEMGVCRDRCSRRR